MFVIIIKHTLKGTPFSHSIHFPSKFLVILMTARIYDNTIIDGIISVAHEKGGRSVSMIQSNAVGFVALRKGCLLRGVTK